MPILIALVVVVLAGIGFMAVMLPLSMIMRYRAGAARRRARGWAASLNFGLSLLSAVVLLTAAAISSMWIPNSFLFTATGLLTGSLLGFAGLWTTRWEASGGVLHYRPNRLLILAITLLVSARIFYGFWRGWHAWDATADTASWLAASGAAGSMGAGGLVLGYYVIYWAGLRSRLARVS